MTRGIVLLIGSTVRTASRRGEGVEYLFAVYEGVQARWLPKQPADDTSRRGASRHVRGADGLVRPQLGDGAALAARDARR